MIGRQKRLIEVYEYVRKHCGIHTQKDFAESLGKSRNAITLALNGNESYLTDKLFKNICETFRGVFDLDYLLTGEGTLLTIEEEVHNQDVEKLFNPSTDDMTSNMLEMYARMIRGVDDIRIQLKDQLADLILSADEQSFDSDQLDALLSALEEHEPLPEEELPNAEESLRAFRQEHASLFNGVEQQSARTSDHLPKRHPVHRKLLLRYRQQNMLQHHRQL